MGRNGHVAIVAAIDSQHFRFNEKKMIVSPPDESKEKTVILISRLTTPLGPMYACATDEGVCLLEFTDRRTLETEFKDLQRMLNGIIFSGENEHLLQLKNELEEYFNGKRTVFEVKLHTPGTAFQQNVWKILQQIPYGHTCSYQEQAKLMGMPDAIRAVASANGVNRISILIPCHRVIGKNGNSTGYGGGLERKMATGL